MIDQRSVFDVEVHMLLFLLWYMLVYMIHELGMQLNGAAFSQPTYVMPSPMPSPVHKTIKYTGVQIWTGWTLFLEVFNITQSQLPSLEIFSEANVYPGQAAMLFWFGSLQNYTVYASITNLQLSVINLIPTHHFIKETKASREHDLSHSLISCYCCKSCTSTMCV